MKKRNMKKPIISALEQRILFDGAAVTTAVDVLDNSSFTTITKDSTATNNDATNNSAENIVHEAQAVQTFEKDRREVAFVDSTVKDYQTLVDGIGKDVEVYLVSSLDEINSILQNQKNINAIHILSHGSTGEITVGNDILNSDTLDENTLLLETIKNSLTENGDILLYGCNVASDGNGEGFINSIAQITQADVAASDDLTGSSTLGGDWILEKSIGVIDTNDLNIASYDGTLAATTFNFSSGTIDINYTNHVRQNIGGVVVDATILDSGTSPTVSGGIFTDSSNQGKTMQFNFSTPSVASSIKVGYYSNTGIVGDFSVKGYDGATLLYSYTISSPNVSTTYTLDLATLGWSSNLTKIEVNNTGAGKVTFFADDIVIAPSNPAPTDIQLSSTLAPQDLTGARIANIRAYDKSGLVSSLGNYPSYAYTYATDTVTFSEVTDSSNLFNVSSSGILSLDSGKSLANGATANITIRATDSANNYFDKTFTITGGAYNSITVTPSTTGTFTYSGTTIGNTYTNTNWTNNDDSFYILAPTASGSDLNDPEWGDTLSSAITYDPLNNAQNVEYVAGASNGTDTFVLGNEYYVVTVGSVVDTTPPTFDVTPSASNVSSTTLDLSASLNEAGTIYYVVVANGATAPSVAQVLAGQDSSGASALKSGNGSVATTPFTGTYNISGLSSNTAYDIYVVGKDSAGTPNVMTTATKVDVTTAGLSATFDFESNMTGVGTKTVTQTVSGVTLSITSTTISIVDSSTTSGQDIQGTTTLSTDYGTALETQLDFSVTGYTFNLDSLIIFNVNTNETFTLTANGQTASLLITSGATPTWNISGSADASKFQNISSFTLTATNPYAIDFDSIILTNITPAGPTAPSAPNMTAGSDSGSSSTDNSTNDNTPTFTGTADANATVNLYDTDGTTVLGTTTANGSGNWSITSSTLSDGAHTITAKQTVSGQESSASSSLSVTIDTSTPSASATTATLKNSTNATVQSSETGTAYIIKDTVIVSNISDITSASDDNFNSITISSANTNTNMALSGLVDGTYKVYSTDTAGNLSSASTNTITIDTTAPTSLAVSTNSISSSITGTNSNIATISATDTHTITYALASGNGTNDANNSSFNISGTDLRTSSALSAGTYNIYLSATDSAGNVTYQALTITVNSGPTVSTATRTYTDTSANDTFTNTTGTISATASSGSITGYGINTGTTGGTDNIGGTVYDVSKAGTYGTLYVKSSDGSYVYVPTSNSAINATSTTVTDAFTIEATDSAGTKGNTLTITINGVNDTPILTAPSAGSYADTSAYDTFSNTTGILSASDRDTGTTLTYGISTGTTGGSDNFGGTIYDISKAGSYGTLYVKSSDGSYVYVPNASAINALTNNTTDNFTVTTSDVGLSDSQTFTVNITGVNDTPTAVNKTITINEDTPTLLSANDFGFSDADSASTLSSIKITTLETVGTLEYYNGTVWTDVTLNQVITKVDIDANKLRFSPSLNGNGDNYSTFQFTVNDGTIDSVSANTITYNVTAVNDAPIVANAIVDQSASVSNAFSFQFATNSFTDVDTSDTLSYTTQLVDGSGNLVNSGTLPTWLSFNSGTRTFSGTPAIGDAGTIYLKVIATDNGTGNLNVSDIFSITVNSGPTVSTATGTYTDTSANDTFTNTTGTISATASSGSITGYGINTGITGGTDNIGGTVYDVSKAGTYGTLYVKSSDGSYVYVPTSNSAINATSTTVTDAFTIEATDSAGTKGNTLTITINGVNDTPTVANIIGNQTATQDSVYNFQFSSNVFSDVDSGDTQTYTAQLVDSNGNLVNSGTLPTWLTFTSGTRTFSGTPTNSDVGIIYIKVIVTDGSSATISDTFALTVNNVNDAPTGSVIINGILKQGETLTASNNIADIDGLGTITYQWYANDVLITGATNSTYLLTQNEVDKVITVKANYTDAQSTNETVTSSATTSIVNVNDAPTVSSENIDVVLPFGNNYVKDISTLFSDIDNSNTFTFEAINLPAGLSINSLTGVISGKPTQSGDFIITIKGIDSGTPAMSISRTYNMLVLPGAQTRVDTLPNIPILNNTNPIGTNTNISLNSFKDNTNLGVLNYSVNGDNVDNTGEGFIKTNETNNRNTQNNTPQNNTDTPNQPNYQTDNGKGMIQSNVNLNVSTNGQVSFNQSNQDSFSVVGITIEDIKVENGRLEIKILDTNLSNNFIITKTDGTPLPAGLSFDPKTGSISGSIPENLEKLEISIKSVNTDGTTKILNLKLDLKQLKNKNQADTQSFIGLQEQVAFENQKLDGYGTYLTKLFA
ncbi:MAG: DUF4347 domain-containing protein [Aliarcobacter sp.]|nr:DUF4347 domain-containing protein [Aliarcobacter sp.]